MRSEFTQLTIYKVFPFKQYVARGTPVPHVIGVTQNLAKTRQRHRTRWKAGEWTPETPLLNAFGAKNLIFAPAGPFCLRKDKKAVLKEYRNRPGCLRPGTTTLPLDTARMLLVVERRERARLAAKLDYAKNRTWRLERQRAYRVRNNEKIRVYRREWMRRRRAQQKNERLNAEDGPTAGHQAEQAKPFE